MTQRSYSGSREKRPLSERLRPLQAQVAGQIVGFFVAYLVVFAIVATLAGILENDLKIGLTGSIVTLGNIGPGFGALGPMATFGDLETGTKLLFMFAMWVGRLEVLAVFVLTVLFTPQLVAVTIATAAKDGTVTTVISLAIGVGAIAALLLVRRTPDVLLAVTARLLGGLAVVFGIVLGVDGTKTL